MRRMRRKAVPVLLFIILLCTLCGCSSGKKGIVSAKNYAPTGGTEEEIQQEQETQKQTGNTKLYMVEQTDTTLGLMLFVNLDTGRNEQYAYTEGTYFLDKYGSHISAADFVPGKIVALELRKGKEIALVKVRMSDTAWEYDDVKRFHVEEENNVFTIADKNYGYDESLAVFLDDARVELNALSDNDTLRIQGIDKKIISISVTTGHGMIILKNTKDLEGGFLSLNRKCYYEITDGMQIEVPEGAYALSVSGNGYGGSTDITVTNQEETVVDLNEIKGEGPKYCTVNFAVDIEGALFYVDNKLVDYTQPQRIQYGIHSLKIAADGYDTWSRRLFVNSAEATIEVSLTAEDGATEEVNETEQESEKDTAKSAGQDSESDINNAYLSTLSEIIDTLTNGKSD